MHTCMHAYIHTSMHPYIHTSIHPYIHTSTPTYLPTYHLPTPYIPLHYIPLHYIPLHYIPLHYIPNHTITLHTKPYHYITLHYIKYIYTCISILYTYTNVLTILFSSLFQGIAQDGVEIPCSVINVASGHESESNLDKQLLDSLEGEIGDGQHGLGTFRSRIFKKYTIVYYIYTCRLHTYIYNYLYVIRYDAASIHIISTIHSS